MLKKIAGIILLFSFLVSFSGFAQDAGEPQGGQTSAQTAPAPNEGGAPPAATEPRPREPAPSEIIVYITKTGEKYHRGTCRYLAKSKIETTLESAKRNYDPCSVCRPPQ
ncbi:hypothetical protein FACS189485_04120 [Spirochaetia bacterium]|nr:hypothetical protein FACS189485_04120 [Spirochaetia bacterium]